VDDAIELPISGRDLLLSIDVSGSMQETDLQLNGQYVDRLQVVQSILTQFIKKRQGDRIGLILFGEKAYLQTPLTFDLKTIQLMLNETRIGIAGISKTAIGDGIGLSIKHLQKRPSKNKVLILLTDGQNNAGILNPIEAAQLAKQAHVKIYTIGVGADKKLQQSLFFGAQMINPSSELDETTLKKVASLTGGQYFRARSTKDLNQIYQLLDQLEAIQDKPETYRPMKPLYYWPLLFAFLLWIIPFIKVLLHSIKSFFTSLWIKKNKEHQPFIPSQDESNVL
jgi:Ca-activated chloride channel family protein